ncbi:MAG: hypothetical protein IJ565_01140 [Bacilli bacterium]|nr:hypothetical protein [Bacilli bacterium]
MGRKLKNGLRIFLIIVLMGALCTNLITPSYATYNELTIDQKIGMNGHVDVPKDILFAGSVVREYHNFGWSITENGQMYFNRFSWWDFDNYYKTLSENGITILPCIQMGEQTIFNRNRNEKPVVKGDDTTDPLSYKIHSSYLFNYAARYGSTKVDTSRLNLDPNETVKTGLGYIHYYEDWNEPDKTWQGPDAQFNSTELAAMLSADYDGHEGRLGENYGIKNADPTSKLVMGGMAGGSAMVTWLTEMQEWANVNRTDKKLPLDVINYHQYAGTHSPENSTFVSDAQKIIAWRDTYASDKEIWITEFGWDTNLGSTKHAAPSEDTQRDWIIREYLIGDRIGLDRMTVYDALNDGPSSDSTQYSTSGLATKVSEGTVKKSSWYGVNTLKYTLKGYRLSSVVKEDNEMYIYKYTNGVDIYYVLWSPTENGTVINDYNLEVGNNKTATITVLKDKEALGVTTDLEVNDTKVTVNVSESPIFVKVSDKIEDVKDSDETKVEEPKEDVKDNEESKVEDTKDNTKSNEETKVEDTQEDNTKLEEKVDNETTKPSNNVISNVINTITGKTTKESSNNTNNTYQNQVTQNNSNTTKQENSSTKTETKKEETKYNQTNDKTSTKVKDNSIHYYDDQVTIPVIIITLILIIILGMIPDRRYA